MTDEEVAERVRQLNDLAGSNKRLRSEIAKTAKEFLADGDQAKFDRRFQQIQEHLTPPPTPAPKVDQELVKVRAYVADLLDEGVPQEVLDPIINLVKAGNLGDASRRLEGLQEGLKQVRQGPEALVMRWRGFYLPGVEYQPGDTLLLAGSVWVCLSETLRTPQQGDEWMLLTQTVAGGGGSSPGAQGPPGPQGPPGAAGPQNLFVQQVDPGMTSPGLWIELDGSNNVKTFWVETG